MKSSYKGFITPPVTVSTMARKYVKKRRPTKRTSTYRKRKSKRTYTKRRAKAKVGNYAHVKLIRPIDRKQRSITQKYVYYGKSRVYNRNAATTIPYPAIPAGNAIIPGNQQCQWITFNANSPYIFCDHAHASPGGSAWEFDDTKYQVPGYNDGLAHPLQPDIPGGLNPTLFPGMYEDVRRALFQYKRHTCIGYKITVTATPMQGSVTHHQWSEGSQAPFTQYNRRESSQEGIVFLMKHTKNTGTNPSQLAPTTSAHDLYKRNFTKCAKFKCGSTSNEMGHPVSGAEPNYGSIISNSGSNQSASISMSYSPKAFQGVKDVMDNGDLKNQTTLDPSFHASDPGTGTLLHQASNTDCITLGIVPWFQARPAGTGNITETNGNASIPRNCGDVLLQYKVEATYVHSDPNRLGDSQAPTTGGDGGDTSAMSM